MQPNSTGKFAVAGLWVEPNHLPPLGGGLVHTTQLSESSGGRAVHTERTSRCLAAFRLR